MDWKNLEENVRKLAGAVWGGDAIPELEAGIRCDIILRHRPDYWILIEISKQDSLAKLREDLAKFAILHVTLMARGIYSERYFVTSGNHASLIESGKAANVEVHTPETFANKFIGSTAYVRERSRAPFGSAVNPHSGERDETSYTPTKYVTEDGTTYNLDRISAELRRGKKFVLVGEFGTGKSRCLMEVFAKLTSLGPTFAPVAINLRENWGYKRLAHIVQNHMEILGLGDYSQPLIRSLRRGNHILLLDGIDEIGSQSWSGDAARLTEIRKISLEGVRNTIEICKSSGMLLTGREHYFSSDDEMAECLGLRRNEYIKIKCPDEFSRTEIKEYITSNTKLSSIPEWVPRKPLVCQLLARLDAAEVKRLDESAHGEVEFFENVLDAICERETRINPAIYKDVLKDILLDLAQTTRFLPSVKEQIATADINESFYRVTGYAPIDESAILLQRLPYLGRIGSGGSERIFVDAYARDGLRGLALARILTGGDKSAVSQKWHQPIGDFATRILASKVKPSDSVEKYIRLCTNHGNSQIACDYVQLCLARDAQSLNFGALAIDGGSFSELRFVDRNVKRLQISSVYIDVLQIENSKFDSTRISDSVVNIVEGIGSADKLPDLFENCTFETFRGAFTISRISELGLSDEHKTLLAIIKKLFFQPGNGREELALLRGTEKYWDRKVADQVLRYMIRSGIVFKAPGSQGMLYIPRRHHTMRMGRIWELQSNSHDELWELVNSPG